MSLSEEKKILSSKLFTCFTDMSVCVRILPQGPKDGKSKHNFHKEEEQKKKKGITLSPVKKHCSEEEKKWKVRSEEAKENKVSQIHTLQVKSNIRSIHI